MKMARRYIRKADRGTEYAAAIRRVERTGFAHASDADAMAGFCDTLPLLVGAVSPRLVWEGAMKYGLKMEDLAKLAYERDLNWFTALMFDEPFTEVTPCPACHSHRDECKDDCPVLAEVREHDHSQQA